MGTVHHKEILILVMSGIIEVPNLHEKILMKKPFTLTNVKLVHESTFYWIFIFKEHYRKSFIRKSLEKKSEGARNGDRPSGINFVFRAVPLLNIDLV